MNQERVLAIFSNVINHFVHCVSATQYCLFVIECGFQQESSFHTNVGRDLIQKIYVVCCSNKIQQYEEKKTHPQEKTFFVHEQCYNYFMTPFDVRYRLFLLSEHVDNKYRYILRQNDSFFTTVHDIIIFFNERTGRLGLACDIEQARRNYKKKENSIISDFFLIHQCCLILRDLCGMVESTISDIDTCMIPLQPETSVEKKDHTRST